MRRETFHTVKALCDGHQRLCSPETWRLICCEEKMQYAFQDILTIENQLRIVAANINDILRSEILSIDRRLHRTIRIRRCHAGKTRGKNDFVQSDLRQQRFRLELARIIDAPLSFLYEQYMRIDITDPVAVFAIESRERVRGLILQFENIEPLAPAYPRLRKIWSPSRPLFTLHSPEGPEDIAKLQRWAEKKPGKNMLNTPLDW